jgi:enoyl-CoA hydratase/carnithine racemase
MAAQPQAPIHVAVDEAIMRVLGAEQAARTEVKQCAADAEAVRQSARAQARRIAERGAERVAKVHRIVDTSIRARIDDLERQRLAVLQTPAESIDEPGRVRCALDRLAAELGDGSA